MNQRQSTSSFFDSISKEYDESIRRCVPRYDEMLGKILEYLPTDRTFNHVLELGCGSGNLSKVLLEKYPAANLTLVDSSPEQIQLTQKRLPESDRLTFVNEDFRELQFPEESLDLVISSISIHHLQDDEKRALFAKIEQWLKPNSFFCFSDQFKGETDSIYQRHIVNWKRDSLAQGATTDEWDQWMQHQADHDFHATLADQSRWLTEQSFHVDCVWRYLLWTVLVCEKVSNR